MTKILERCDLGQPWKTYLVVALIIGLLIGAGVGWLVKPPVEVPGPTVTVTTTVTAPPTPVTPTPPPPPPPKEILFRYPLVEIVRSGDPAIAGYEADLIFVINMYDPLLYPNVEEGSPAPRPHLATEWSVSPDGKTYTFKLREGVKFHDGSELTAEDVQFSMDRMLRMKRGYAWLWSGILDPGSTEVVDDYTVRFHLNKAYAPFLASMELFFIVNKDVLMREKKSGDFGEFGDYGQAYLEDNEAGSGPFTIESWIHGHEIMLKRFEDYWRSWKPNSPTTVRISIIEEAAPVKTAFLKGDLDMTHMWLEPAVFAALKEVSGVYVDEKPSLQLLHAHMNCKKPPTDNKWFRYAISYAFDYESACKEIAEGAAQAEGPVPNRAWGHSDTVKVFHQDLEKAREYLEMSGYKPGEATIEIAYWTASELERRIALLLKSNLAEIGINAEILTYTGGMLGDLATSVETTPHMTFIFDTLKYPHPDSHTYGIYHSSIRGTYRTMHWYENKTIDDLMDSARAETDPDKQIEIYELAQDYITENAPCLWVLNTPHRIALWNYVKGYVYVGLLGYDTNYWYFEVEK